MRLPVRLDPKSFDRERDPLREVPPRRAPTGVHAGGVLPTVFRVLGALSRRVRRRRTAASSEPAPGPVRSTSAAGRTYRRFLFRAAALVFLLLLAYVAGDLNGLGKVLRAGPQTSWSYRCQVGAQVAIVQDSAACTALRREIGSIWPPGTFWYGAAAGAAGVVFLLALGRARRKP